MTMRKPYKAKDDKDPGLILGPDPDHVPEPKHAVSSRELLILNRDLLLKIAEKLGVPID